MMCEYITKCGCIFSNMIMADDEYAVYGTLFELKKAVVEIQWRELLFKNCVCDTGLVKAECYDLVDWKFRDDVGRFFWWSFWNLAIEKYKIYKLLSANSVYYKRRKGLSSTVPWGGGQDFIDKVKAEALARWEARGE